MSSGPYFAFISFNLEATKSNASSHVASSNFPFLFMRGCFAEIRNFGSDALLTEFFCNDGRNGESVSRPLAPHGRTTKHEDFYRSPRPLWHCLCRDSSSNAVVIDVYIVSMVRWSSPINIWPPPNNSRVVELLPVIGHPSCIRMSIRCDAAISG